jgi:hypothetical protein
MFRASWDAPEMLFTSEKQPLKTPSIVPMIEAIVASSAMVRLKRLGMQCESLHFAFHRTDYLEDELWVKSIAASHRSTVN